MADAKSELKILKSYGATPQPNSGRGKHKKGDGILGPFMVDVKEYEKSYSISRDNWAKVCTDAAGQRLQPMIALALGEETTIRSEMVVVGKKMFLEMLEAWEEKYGE